MFFRVALALTLVVPSGAQAQNRDHFFAKSYALVIGVNSYAHAKWPELNYAVKDAQGVAAFLRDQGFEVIELAEEKATRAAILSAIEDTLIPRLTKEDRVVLFFAGHGATRPVGDSERGYLVPADGTDSYGSLIPITQLHDLSDAMGTARHQLFILDSCFGGLAAMRTGVPGTIDPRTPEYIREISKRRARQLLTAGGANQKVRDGGPDQHSLFTGQLLRALQDGIADGNGDGYITFTELSGYIQFAASQYNQTPGTDSLAGHEQGDFWFTNSARGGVAAAPPAPTPPAATPDVYQLIRAGKRAFLDGDYARARQAFLTAAEIGNAEAMGFLGKLYWDGKGGPEDKSMSIEWLKQAAERGNIGSMENLVIIYSNDPYKDPDAERRWKAALAEALKLAGNVTLIDPTGMAGRGEPALSPYATRIAPPTNLRIISQ